MSVPKQYLCKKGDLFVSYDGKTLTDRPSKAMRLSKTRCQRKYPGYQMIGFVEAYDEWFARKKSNAGGENG
jgi:uncharacterized protein (DUF3820 family)